MQANLSVFINILLLAGVIIAIVRMVRTKRQSLLLKETIPVVPTVHSEPQDDIIAVRKISLGEDDLFSDPAPIIAPKTKSPGLTKPKLSVANVAHEPLQKNPMMPSENSPSLVMFLLAKENRQLAGYELLQTVLACGLRFGEGHLFHRHQYPNGQGPILCSLAAATSTGVFDLQNIGAFSVHGLCLFMQASGNPTIDSERFNIMLDTAKQLSEGLDTHLLDDKRQPLTEASIQRYYDMLHLTEDEACIA